MLLNFDRSTDFRDWVGDRLVTDLSSNIDSKRLPFQSWRPFKEAFAPEIVQRAIYETPGTINRLLDPFGGSGTSALTSQFLGVEPTTIEVNPFLSDLIEAKLTTYDIEELTLQYAATFGALKKVHSGRPVSLVGMPATFVEPGVKGRYIFSAEVAKRIAKLLKAIDGNCDQKSARLFKIITATIAIDVSNIVISGKGRRYRKNWQARKIGADTIDELFQSRILSAIRDISRHGRRSEQKYTVLNGDCREVLSAVPQHDVAVFSPPYPNSFDYTDVYNVELWLLGYISDSASNRRLRNMTLRSHVQIKRDYENDSSYSSILSAAYANLCNSREKLWSKDIPEMVVSYFTDMRGVLTNVSKSIRKKGRIYCIVGDSQYAGIAIPVAKIIGQMDRQCELKLLYSEEFRSMRASPQQGGRLELPETMLVFEKI